MKNYMKRYIHIILGLICYFSVGIASTEETKHITLTYSESDFRLDVNPEGKLEISPIGIIAAYPAQDQLGLPLIGTDVAVRGNRTYKSSSVKLSKRLISSGKVVANSPECVPTSSLGDGGTDLPWKPGIPVDTTNFVTIQTVFPESNWEYTSAGCWENISVLHFLNCPFIYYSTSKELYLIEKFEIDIVTDEKPGNEEGVISRHGASYFKSIVHNKSDVDSLLALGERNNMNRPTVAAKDKIEYLIITNEALKNSFEPLLKWKRTKGLYSSIITVEDIEKKYEGDDLPLQIKNCLYDLYQNNELKYVLLGGDDTVVPVKICVGYKSESNLQGLVPVDQYYACFGNDFYWDGNKKWDLWRI